MGKTLKCSKKELLFFIAYFLLGFADIVIVNSFLFGDARLKIYEVVLYVAAFFAVLSFCTGKNRLKDIIRRLIVILIGFLITIEMHKISFGVSILLMVIAANIDAQKIIKNSVRNNIFFTVIVVLPALIGLIPNEVYNHNGINAYCLGFQYYSTFPNLTFSLTLFLYLLANTKIKKRAVLILSLPVQLIVYKYCTVRLIFYSYLIFLLLAIIEQFYNKNKNHKLITNISSIMFPMACAATFVVSMEYKHSGLLNKLNQICNYRFSFNALGYARYGLSLFGAQIETNAGTIDSNYINHYFYIDSGYVYSLLSYGIVFFVLLLLIYSLYARYAAKNNDSRLMVICFVICVYSVINNLLFDIALNPIPLLASQTIFINRRTKAIHHQDAMNTFKQRHYAIKE